MMSMYGKYILERERFHIIEDDKGFATYGLSDVYGEKAYYIKELYVEPEFRQQGIASAYADQIAKIAKCNGVNILLGSIEAPKDAYDEEPHYRMLVLLAYGFKLLASDDKLVWFIKRI